VLWAIVRRETTEVYVTLLADLKQDCEGQMQEGNRFKPSCCLVDNSDPEINAARYELPSFRTCAVMRTQLLLHRLSHTQRHFFVVNKCTN
jgi:hypothetical protein